MISAAAGWQTNVDGLNGSEKECHYQREHQRPLFWAISDKLLLFNRPFQSQLKCILQEIVHVISPLCTPSVNGKVNVKRGENEFHNFCRDNDTLLHIRH